MAGLNNAKLPQQKLAYSKKTKKWRKDCVDYADRHSFYHNESVRKSLRNRIINFNLYNGIVNAEDMIRVVNPANLQAEFIPDNLPHHPIIVPKVDLLVGEESKRRFDWKVLITNPEAITLKEQDRRDQINADMMSLLDQNLPEEQLQAELEKLEKYYKYEYQDIRERLGNQIMRHYWQELRMEKIFLDCMKDLLISSEEVVQIDIVGKEPHMKKLNGLKVHAIRSGNSDRIEDSEITILEDHWSPSSIVDYFYEELQDKDVDHILDYSVKNGNSSYSDDENNHTLLRDGLEGFEHGGGSLDTIFNIAEINGHYFSSDYVDQNGNVRVLRVYWKSKKKIKEVTRYDPVTGDEEKEWVSEEYIPNRALGETVKESWVNEMWEGTKIGRDIYIQMKPSKVQYNRLSNPSRCHAGIIGQLANTNQGVSVSLVDRCKNYQYMYDAVSDRLNRALASNYGKIFEMDLAKIPKGWEVEKWLHYATVNKFAVIDSFKVGDEGPATGKLAGSFNTQGGRSIDMSTGNEIQQYILILEFIKAEMSEIAGVTKQREGQVSNRETVGGIERSVNQSAHITEYWFALHEEFKLRAMNAFLQAALIALRENPLKAQQILDDQTIQLLNTEEIDIASVDMGVFCTSSRKSIKAEQLLEQLSQAFVQNGGRMSTILDIVFSHSLSDQRRKLEEAEDKIREENSKAAEQANQVKQQEIQAKQALDMEKLKVDERNNIRDNETKLLIANEQSDDGIQEPEESADDIMLKMRELDDKMKMHKDKMKREDKKIAIQGRKSTSSSSS